MNSSPRPPSRHGGFSLLEMVVALAILAISLSVLYRVAGGATRTVSVDEKMTYGVELARSLLTLHKIVPVAGVESSGETAGGFIWQVVANPLLLSEDIPLAEGQLQSIRVEVSWPDGEKDRSFVLHSVVAGMEQTE